MKPLRSLFKRWLGLGRKVEQSPKTPHRGIQDHVIILDGTLSSLEDGHESNAGLLYKLLSQLPLKERPHLRYESGAQWPTWRSSLDVLEGRGINKQIRRTYGVLASRYHPDDRIFLFGYSRGAFAVRSLAGMIDQVGLLKAKHATVRNIRLAYRLYQGPPDTEAIQAFQAAYCYPSVDIEMVGVWDTVKALGNRLPVFWRLTDHRYAFHNHNLGHSAKHGYHALALDETRQAFAPVMWSSPKGWDGHVQQMWFRGSHGDVGGQLGGFLEARPLSNIPFVWMVEKAEALNLALPEGWRSQFPCDPNAPSVGRNRSWGKLFMSREKRIIGRDRSERIHSSVPANHPAQIPLKRLHENGV
ncbi:DUF2235 domain-containing protein [Falsihalocynthiibacter sp. SS001]|uniref:DUF2235 domain-containing protein n=1 Tax=Falsihalocynthiibacter sp. SS001 TaxID=3349698 RepID=UPI0036D37F9D